MGIRVFPCLFFFTSDDVNGSSVFSEQMGGKCWDLGFPSAVATVNIWIGVHVCGPSRLLCVFQQPKPRGAAGTWKAEGLGVLVMTPSLSGHVGRFWPVCVIV